MTIFTPIELTEEQRSTLLHALRIAAGVFDEHAGVSTEENMPRLAEQFTRQAAQSRELADRMERAEFIRLGKEIE